MSPPISTHSHQHLAASMESRTNSISTASQERAAERARVGVENLNAYSHQLLVSPLQKLSLKNVPNDARVIIPPTPHLTTKNFGSDCSTVHIATDDLVVVQQTSKEAWFTFTSGKQVCRFFYDAGSDNLVLQNIGEGVVDVACIDPETNRITSTCSSVKPRETVVITPGPWRISSVSAKQEILVEFLLLRRRYSLETLPAGPSVAGLKRKGPPAIESSTKRTAITYRNNDRSILLFHNPNQEKSLMDRTKTIAVGNPLVDLEPGARISIKTVDETGSTTGKTTENYSVMSLRNVAKSKGLRSVFRADHTALGGIVVKVVTERTGSTSSIPKIARNWLNEVRSMCGHDHPAIIKFYGSDARFYSIYMEYLPYFDLAASTWANPAGAYYFTGTLDDAIRVFGGMASAIEYIHGKKIIHNDIKPANIVYDPARGPVLIDFGHATAFGDLPLRAGTEWYIPAELLTSDSRGYKSDIFALGVVMLYMLKKLPLPESTGPRWQIGSIKDDPAPMRNWLDKIAILRHGLEPKGLEGLVKDTLIARPDERISAEDIVKKLQHTVGREPISQSRGYPVAHTPDTEVARKTAKEDASLEDIKNGVHCDNLPHPPSASIPSWHPWDPLEERPLQWNSSTGWVHGDNLQLASPIEQASVNCATENRRPVYTAPRMVPIDEDSTDHHCPRNYDKEQKTSSTTIKYRDSVASQEAAFPPSAGEGHLHDDMAGIARSERASNKYPRPQVGLKQPGRKTSSPAYRDESIPPLSAIINSGLWEQSCAINQVSLHPAQLTGGSTDPLKPCKSKGLTSVTVPLEIVTGNVNTFISSGPERNTKVRDCSTDKSGSELDSGSEVPISVTSNGGEYRTLTYGGKNISFSTGGYINMKHLRCWLNIAEAAWRQSPVYMKTPHNDRKILGGRSSRAGAYFKITAAKKVLQAFTNDLGPIDEIEKHLKNLEHADFLEGFANGHCVSMNAKSNEWNFSEILLASYLNEAERLDLQSDILHILPLRVEHQANQTVYWISFRNGIRLIRYLGLEEELAKFIASRDLYNPPDEQALNFERGSLLFTLHGEVRFESVVNWVGCSSTRAINRYLVKTGFPKRNEYGGVKIGGQYISLDDAKQIFQHYGHRVKPLENIENSLRGRLLQTLDK